MLLCRGSSPLTKPQIQPHPASFCPLAKSAGGGALQCGRKRRPQSFGALVLFPGQDTRFQCVSLADPGLGRVPLRICNLVLTQGSAKFVGFKCFVQLTNQLLRAAQNVFCLQNRSPVLLALSRSPSPSHHSVSPISADLSERRARLCARPLRSPYASQMKVVSPFRDGGM